MFTAENHICVSITLHISLRGTPGNGLLRTWVLQRNGALKNKIIVDSEQISGTAL